MGRARNITRHSEGTNSCGIYILVYLLFGKNTVMLTTFLILMRYTLTMVTS